MRMRVGGAQIDATDLPTLLVAVLDVIKQEGLKIVEICHPPKLVLGKEIESPFLGGRVEEQDKLLIRVKPGFLRQFFSRELNVIVGSKGVNFEVVPPSTGAAQHAAATLQNILETREYPTEPAQIQDYAMQRLEKVRKDQKKLFLRFLNDWIQQAKTIARLAERVDLEPLNPNVYLELGQALERFSRGDVAKEYYLKALALEPVGPLVAGKANVGLGRFFIQDDRLKDRNRAEHYFQQSVKEFRKYIRRNPDDLEEWKRLSFAYMWVGHARILLGKSSAKAYAESEKAAARAEILRASTPTWEKALEVPLKDKSGLAFEEKCLCLLRAMGFHARTTKRTGDGGIDIVATSTQPLLAGQYVVQCKNWSNPVGEPVIRDLYGAVMGTRANKGILIISSTFTEPAKDFAQGKQLELIDGEELERLYRMYVENP